jgi:hypothetical protein
MKGVTTQKTPFFIVTAVKTSNLTLIYVVYNILILVDSRQEKSKIAVKI